MAKFKMRFKLTGLEIEIEGDRQDASQLTNAISNQLGGILAPAANVASLGNGGEHVIDVESTVPPATSTPSKGRKKTGSVKSSKTPSSETEAIDWRNDVGIWGSPKQSWTTAQKSLWLLHTVTQQTEHKELSAGIIAASFNKHFRQAGSIRPSNVSRDLGGFKTKKKPAWVNEDTTVDPPKWFLTAEGVKQADILVVEAKGSDS